MKEMGAVRAGPPRPGGSQEKGGTPPSAWLSLRPQDTVFVHQGRADEI